MFLVEYKRRTILLLSWGQDPKITHLPQLLLSYLLRWPPRPAKPGCSFCFRSLPPESFLFSSPQPAVMPSGSTVWFLCFLFPCFLTRPVTLLPGLKFSHFLGPHSFLCQFRCCWLLLSLSSRLPFHLPSGDRVSWCLSYANALLCLG